MVVTWSGTHKQYMNRELKRAINAGRSRNANRSRSSHALYAPPNKNNYITKQAISRAWGGFFGLAVNSNFKKIAKEIYNKYPNAARTFNYNKTSSRINSNNRLNNATRMRAKQILMHLKKPSFSIL